MIRPHLLAWQWSDYAARHRSRANLLLHIVTVPLFELGTLLLIWSIVAGWAAGVGLGLASLVAALVAQGRGHRGEVERPTPFDGPGDFVTRFVVEQWVTFPRFVLSGGWSRNLRGDER